MNCKEVQRSLSGFCDDLLPAQNREEIRSHLAACAGCASESERMLEQRQTLLGLPRLSPPAELDTAVRVLASRERVRRLSRRSLGAMLGHWGARLGLWVGGMLRPVALPTAGGLLSAVALFVMLAPTFALPERSDVQDVPIWLSTEATFVSMGPFGIADDEIVLDLTVGPEGRVIDYSTPGGQFLVKNPKARRAIENALLFTVFTPGTTFGQPASARVRLTFRRSEIDVKG